MVNLALCSFLEKDEKFDVWLSKIMFVWKYCWIKIIPQDKDTEIINVIL